MAKEHTREGKFKREGGGLALAGITLAYFAAPFVSRADPEWLVGGGLLIAIGIEAIYGMMVLNQKSRTKQYITGIILISGIITLGLAGVTATYQNQALDRHCAVLQNEMLNGRAPGTAAPSPGRSDAADVFQALGCRPRWNEPWW